jgi:hypothetical protein
MSESLAHLIPPEIARIGNAPCDCGRSPTGKCVGWHGMDEERLTRAREAYEIGMRMKADRIAARERETANVG